MIIDTHVHYNLEPLSSQAQQYLDAAREHSIETEIIVGTSVETSVLAMKQAQQFSTFFSAGTHPTEYQERIEQAIKHDVHSFEGVGEEAHEELSHIRLLAQDERCKAIGEVGLDYYHLPDEGVVREESMKIQRRMMAEHIRIANDLHLPVIFHVRDKQVSQEKKVGNAYWDALDILMHEKPQAFTLHCVSGPLSYVKAALELGGYVGFDGNITYPNAQAIREIFDLVPEDRRLVETDAPFLPPQEFRGKICEPWMVEKTVEYIEQELRCDRHKLVENAERLFNI